MTARSPARVAVKKSVQRFVAQIDMFELATRLCEVGTGTARPQGYSAAQAIMSLPEEDRLMFLRLAEAAATYLRDAVNEGSEVQ